MKLQRTGLTEGSLIFNDWLKKHVFTGDKTLYRRDTEDEFINWLYSTSGWYDKDIKGSYFDIDVEAVRRSANYQRFLLMYPKALENSDWFHLMLHSDYHLNGLEFQDEFAKQFSSTNRQYWKDVPFLQNLINGKRVLVISSIANLISQKYGVLGYNTPSTHLNSGDEQNSWQTLEKMILDIEPLNFDIALVSCGAYGVFLTDRIVRMGKDAATIGSGIYDLFPVGKIPDDLKPRGWEKIENGRYWQ